MKVFYEPHPVTPERKAELRDKGFTIIDARFEPPSEAVAQPIEAPPKRLARKWERE